MGMRFLRTYQFPNVDAGEPRSEECSLAVDGSEGFSLSRGERAGVRAGVAG